MTLPDCDLTRHLQAIVDRQHEEWTPAVAASKQHAQAALGLLKDARIFRPDENSVTQWEPFLKVPLTEDTPNA